MPDKNVNQSGGATSDGKAMKSAPTTSAAQSTPQSSDPVPPPLPEITDMSQGFQAILGAIQKSSDEIKTKIRSEVKAGFEMVNNRIDEVEDEVVQLQLVTLVAVCKIAVLENCTTTTEKTVNNIDQRVLALESGGSGIVKKQTLTKVIASKTSQVCSLVAEAQSYQRVAVVGCHGGREPTKSGIARLINSHSSGIEVRYKIRGLVARVTFGEDRKNPPATRAWIFVEDIN
jgi:hypothetical protein